MKHGTAQRLERHVQQLATVIGERNVHRPHALEAARRYIEKAWSDHLSFWLHGYKAMMVTDTAFYRYPYYHTPQDTAEKLDYERLARVVHGISYTVLGLAGHPD